MLPTLKLMLLAGLCAASATLAWHYHVAAAPEGWMFWTIWCAMTAHQVEELVATEALLGPRGAFLPWVRRLGYDVSPLRAIGLNCGVAWVLAVAAGAAGSRMVALPLFVVGVEAVNAAWHLEVMALRREWSPGSLTSLLTTIPLAFWLFHWSLSEQSISPAACIAIWLAAWASHHVFFLTLPRVRSVE